MTEKDINKILGFYDEDDVIKVLDTHDKKIRNDDKPFDAICIILKENGIPLGINEVMTVCQWMRDNEVPGRLDASNYFMKLMREQKLIK